MYIYITESTSNRIKQWNKFSKYEWYKNTSSGIDEPAWQ